MTALRPDAPLTEARLQALVIELCGLLGLRHYHTHDSRRSVAGFPDLVIVGTKIIFRELKSDTGKLSAEQQRWVVELHAAGADVAVWRPGDWPDLVNAELSAIRRHR